MGRLRPPRLLSSHSMLVCCIGFRAHWGSHEDLRFRGSSTTVPRPPLHYNCRYRGPQGSDSSWCHGGCYFSFPCSHSSSPRWRRRLPVGLVLTFRLFLHSLVRCQYVPPMSLHCWSFTTQPVAPYRQIHAQVIVGRGWSWVVWRDVPQVMRCWLMSGMVPATDTF